jgi:hypothetical protein
VSGSGKNNTFVLDLVVSCDYTFRENMPECRALTIIKNTVKRCILLVVFKRMPECLRHSCAKSENKIWHNEKLGN